jgi:AbrB family looped-hinge helix DNA binding protein
MRQTLIVSSRGQITLPAEVRKQFGIRSGEPVIIEERNGELVLKPATVLEVEMYTPEQVAAWDREDRLDEAERQRVLARLKKPVKARSTRG